MTENHLIRLRPGAAVFEISPEQIQIVFANHTATFHSVPVVRGIRALAAELDTPAPREGAVRRAARAAGLDLAFVERLADMLENSRCLTVESSPAKGRRSALSDFYAALGVDPAPVLERLAQSPLVVVAPEAAGQRLHEILHAGGIAADVVLLGPEVATFDALRDIEHHLDEAERRNDTANAMLAVWDFAYRLPFARLVNDFAIGRHLPVLFGCTEGAIGRIGPLVLPRSTACLECLNARLLSHAGAPEMEAIRQYRLRRSDRAGAPWPTHPVFQDALLGLFVVELSAVLRGVPSRALGGFIEHGVEGGGPSRHPVYRVPRCPACTPEGAGQLAWDDHFAAHAAPAPAATYAPQTPHTPGDSGL